MTSDEALEKAYEVVKFHSAAAVIDAAKVGVPLDVFTIVLMRFSAHGLIEVLGDNFSHAEIRSLFDRAIENAFCEHSERQKNEQK